jgi:hypothetical protein
VCLGNALDGCQAEADPGVVGAYAFGAANKLLDNLPDKKPLEAAKDGTWPF